MLRVDQILCELANPESQIVLTVCLGCKCWGCVEGKMEG